MITEKHEQGTRSIKIMADKLAENTAYAPKSISPNCLPKPRNLWFQWKKTSLGVRSPCLQLQYYTRGSLFYSCKRTILFTNDHPITYAIVLHLIGSRYQENLVWTRPHVHMAKSAPGYIICKAGGTGGQLPPIYFTNLKRKICLIKWLPNGPHLITKRTPEHDIPTKD